MKPLVLSLERITTGFAIVIACIMMVIAASLGMFQVITRFILEQPAEWTEVMIRFSLIWMVFMGIPMALRQGAMVSVDVVYRWGTPRIKRMLNWAVFMATLGLILVIIYWGWDYANRGKNQTVIGLESISMFWAYLAMPVGGVFSIVGLIGNLLDPQRNELESAQ